MRNFLAIILSFLLIISIGGTLVFAGNDKITLYISGPQEMIAALEKKFEKKYGDVLNVLATGCGPLKQKVWTEMMAGSIQADIIWGAEPMMYYSLRQKGVLQRYVSLQTKKLQKQYNYGNGYYTPVNARYGVILYNWKKTPQASIPESWKDLTQKCWDHQIVLADAAQSAMALALAAGLYDISGQNWNLLKAYNDNHLILTKTNVSAIAKVESGEALVGIAPHDGVLRLIKKARKKGFSSPLRIVWPNEGAISVQRPIAIIKKNRSAKANQLTRKFVDFSLSEPAQKIAVQFGFISVCAGFPLPGGVPATVKAKALDWANLAKRETKLTDDFTKIMAK